VDAGVGIKSVVTKVDSIYVDNVEYLNGRLSYDIEDSTSLEPFKITVTATDLFDHSTTKILDVNIDNRIYPKMYLYSNTISVGGSTQIDYWAESSDGVRLQKHMMLMVEDITSGGPETVLTCGQYNAQSEPIPNAFLLYNFRDGEPVLSIRQLRKKYYDVVVLDLVTNEYDMRTVIPMNYLMNPEFLTVIPENNMMGTTYFAPSEDVFNRQYRLTLYRNNPGPNDDWVSFEEEVSIGARGHGYPCSEDAACMSGMCFILPGGRMDTPECADGDCGICVKDGECASLDGNIFEDGDSVCTDFHNGGLLYVDSELVLEGFEINLDNDGANDPMANRPVAHTCTRIDPRPRAGETTQWMVSECTFGCIGGECVPYDFYVTHTHNPRGSTVRAPRSIEGLPTYGGTVSYQMTMTQHFDNPGGYSNTVEYSSGGWHAMGVEILRTNENSITGANYDKEALGRGWTIDDPHILILDEVDQTVTIPGRDRDGFDLAAINTWYRYQYCWNVNDPPPGVEWYTFINPVDAGSYAAKILWWKIDDPESTECAWAHLEEPNDDLRWGAATVEIVSDIGDTEIEDPSRALTSTDLTPAAPIVQEPPLNSYSVDASSSTDVPINEGSTYTIEVLSIPDDWAYVNFEWEIINPSTDELVRLSHSLTIEGQSFSIADIQTELIIFGDRDTAEGTATVSITEG